MEQSDEQLELPDADARGGGGGEDRLSALPDDLLIHILVKIDDAAEAARTSVLAGRWRRLWAFLPELSFAVDIEHHRIGPALAAHQAPDLSVLFAATRDASPESLAAWLPVAARRVSGTMFLEVVRREEAQESGAIDLPCFDRATSISVDLGLLRLALPPCGAFARLEELELIRVQLHGRCGLGDAVSSLRCPSLRYLAVRDARGLDTFTVCSESLLQMELSRLRVLQELTVVAPALEKLKVCSCFTDALDPDRSFANISAPQLTMLEWKNGYDPTSLQLGDMANLEWLGVELFNLDGDDEEAFAHNHHWMMLLRRFERISTFDLMLYYPSETVTDQYLMKHMPRLPDVTFLALGVMAYGHSLGAASFDVLRRSTSVKMLDLDFQPEDKLKEQTACPSDCVCDQPPNWRTQELVLHCLEEVEIHGLSGTEHELALVERLFSWATVLKKITVVFHELMTESNAKELRQLLLSFSRPGICMNVSMFVP